MDKEYKGYSNDTIKKTGAKLTKDREKVKKFIKLGKVPNGTNGIYITLLFDKIDKRD